MVLGEALQRWAACLGMNSTGACTLAAGDGWMVLGLLCLVFVAAVHRAEARHSPLDLAGHGVGAGALPTLVKMGEIL